MYPENRRINRMLFNIVVTSFAFRRPRCALKRHGLQVIELQVSGGHREKAGSVRRHVVAAHLAAGRGIRVIATSRDVVPAEVLDAARHPSAEWIADRQQRRVIRRLVVTAARCLRAVQDVEEDGSERSF